MGDKYNKCAVNNGITDGISVIINEGNSNSDFKFEKFSKLLDDMLDESDDATERMCALEAKRYADEKDESNLKQFLIKNFSTFSNGTFATLAGGLLLEMVKKLIGI